MRKAFALIELLVITSTLAVLAAILSPVFAQAKDASANARMLKFRSKGNEVGTAIYQLDHDDLQPILKGTARRSHVLLGDSAAYSSFSVTYYTAAGTGLDAVSAHFAASWTEPTYHATDNGLNFTSEFFNSSGGTVFTIHHSIVPSAQFFSSPVSDNVGTNWNGKGNLTSDYNLVPHALKASIATGDYYYTYPGGLFTSTDATVINAVVQYSPKSATYNAPF